MRQLKSKSDVIEWYWPDFLKYVMKKRNYSQKYDIAAHIPEITIPEFWKWYTTDGPMGVKETGRWYTKEDVEYV